jgi:hypothetical protein
MLATPMDSQGRRYHPPRIYIYHQLHIEVGSAALVRSPVTHSEATLGSRYFAKKQRYPPIRLGPRTTPDSRKSLRYLIARKSKFPPNQLDDNRDNRNNGYVYIYLSSPSCASGGLVSLCSDLNVERLRVMLRRDLDPAPQIVLQERTQRPA